MTDDEMRAMLIEYMGRGFLENIIALFRQEPELMRFIPDLAASEELSVRLGVTALVEEMAGKYRRQLRIAVPGLVKLLENNNPTIRGDAANIIGLIGESSERGALERLIFDPQPAVREIAGEAIKIIEERCAKENC